MPLSAGFRLRARQCQQMSKMPHACPMHARHCPLHRPPPSPLALPVVSLPRNYHPLHSHPQPSYHFLWGCSGHFLKPRICKPTVASALAFLAREAPCTSVPQAHLARPSLKEWGSPAWALGTCGMEIIIVSHTPSETAPKARSQTPPREITQNAMRRKLRV